MQNFKICIHVPKTITFYNILISFFRYIGSKNNTLGAVIRYGRLCQVDRKTVHVFMRPQDRQTGQCDLCEGMIT
jgi:hypothetical protein